MDLNEYQKFARKTAIYPDVGHNIVYPALGIGGEAGEIQEKIKKILRDKGGIANTGDIRAIRNELGDLLWYIANLAEELGLPLNEIAVSNISKLQGRVERNKVHGEGDNR